MTELKVGQSLTPEQVRNLPDGAEVEVYGSKANAPFKIVLRDCTHKKYIANEIEYFGLCCDLVSLPTAPSEPNRRIEPQAEPASPELPVWVITCERCGTTYKNNERHACVASEPAKPELDSGYRWVNIGERIIDTDEYLTSYGKWMQTGGLEFKCTVARKYRRRIVQQEEPSKPERQASDIEKEAAMALIEQRRSFLQTSILSVGVSEISANVLYTWASFYTEAYDYAKSIGAIE